ncbi:histidine kinase [Galbibacter orientalis DSM 19592]|uniref:histidine kinase n=1 Tax=Galbibacter orientalis DSM 19592 TaxID=926559 RepID=I3C1A8_9FLAO|nr:HAMP domain-containing sensor histidine kinase [Galbibacter orientalis]EIJ37401.1 histidine kinase [Galbibacter orientalis DSM 19592]
MNTTEDKLRERIKELTCLYEVTSIIVNCDYSQLELSLQAIAHCLKGAVQYETESYVKITTNNYVLEDGSFKESLCCIKSNIKVFNEVSGTILIGYPSDKFSEDDFLDEEKKLLENVCLEIGNLIERKQIRDNEAYIKKQMERTDRLNILGEITAGIAHELNTPLTNILGFTELLEDEIKDKKQLSDLGRIKESAIFSREIVKKLMFFACEVPQQMQKVTLKPIVDNVLNLLKPSFKNKNIQSIFDIESPDLQIRADEIQITQVLFNIIMNAIYASPEHSKVEISIKKLKGNIQVKIIDEGSGIASTIEDKVYEPFFTTKPTGDGSGLGLSVVHGIISSHKGTIKHSKNSPKGTIFTINFPEN